MFRCKEGLHHDVHSAELRPHLQAHTQHNPSGVSILQEIEVRFCTFFSFKVDLLLDLLVFKDNEIVLCATLAV